MVGLEWIFTILLIFSALFVLFDQDDAMTFSILIFVCIVFRLFTSNGNTSLEKINSLSKNDYSEIINKLSEKSENNIIRYEAKMEFLRGETIPAWLSLGQNLLISLGLIGTFFGLTLGLFDAIPLFAKGGTENMTEAMKALFDGAKLAFAKSLAGVMAAALWSFRYAMIESAWERCYHLCLEKLNIKNTDDLLFELIEIQHKIHNDVYYEIKELKNTLSNKSSSIEMAIGNSIEGSLANQINSLKKATQEVERAIRIPEAQDHFSKQLVYIKNTIKSIELLIRSTDDQGSLFQRIASLQETISTEKVSISEQIGSVKEATHAVERAIRPPDAIDSLSILIQQIGEQLPEKFGQTASIGVSSAISLSLAPKLEAMSEALRRLSNTQGGIADKVNRDIQGDVSSLSGGLKDLRSELQQVVAALAVLPANVNAGIAKGSEAAGLELSGQLKDAGGALAQVLTGAADRLQQGGEGIAASTERLQAAVQGTTALAKELADAGERVRDSLTNVSAPIDRAAAAIAGAAGSFQAAGAEVDAAGGRLMKLAQGLISSEEAMRKIREQERAAAEDLNRAIVAASTSLLGFLPQVSALRAACEALTTSVQQTSEESASKTREIIGLLMATLAQFGEDLQRISAALDGQSRQMFKDHETRTKTSAEEIVAAMRQGAERFSEEMGGAARELQAGGVGISASTKELQQALEASLGLATALQEAGEQVRAGLVGVHLPIAVAASAISGAATKFEGAGTSAAAASDRLQALGRQILEAEELMRELRVEERAATQDLNSAVGKTAGSLIEIVPRLELLMQASAALAATLGQTGSQTQEQTGQAMALLMATLTKFGEDLKGITAALDAQSGKLFTDTSARAQEAAERVSAALEKGSEKFAQAMGDIDARSERLSGLFGLLDHTTEQFAKHGADLTQNLGVASTSLGEVVESLQMLPPELDRAMEAMRLEQQSIEGLAKLLSAATSDVRALLKAVKDERAELQKEVPSRLEQIEQARKLLEASWERGLRIVTEHVRQLGIAQEDIMKAWEQASKARNDGLEHNAKEIARYAALVEQSLKLPTDLRSLDKAIIELVDVLDALKRALQPPAVPPSTGNG